MRAAGESGGARDPGAPGGPRAAGEGAGAAEAEPGWNEPITAGKANSEILSEGLVHLVVSVAEALLCLVETALVFEISLHEAAGGLFSLLALFELLARLPLRAFASAAARGFSEARARGGEAVDGAAYLAYYSAVGLCWAALSCVLFTPLAPYLRKALEAPYPEEAGLGYLYLGLSLGALVSVFVEGARPFLLAEGRLWCYLSGEASRFLVQTAALFMAYFAFIQRANRAGSHDWADAQAAAVSPMVAYCVAGLVSTVVYLLALLRVPVFQAPQAGSLSLDFRALRPLDTGLLRGLFLGALQEYLSAASYDVAYVVFNWCLSVVSKSSAEISARRSAFYMCVRLRAAVFAVPATFSALATCLYSRTVLCQKYERVRVFTIYMLIWGVVLGLLVALGLYFLLPIYQKAIVAAEARLSHAGRIEWELSAGWATDFSRQYLPMTALSGVAAVITAVTEALARAEGNAVVHWTVCVTRFALPIVGALCMTGIVGFGVELSPTFLAAEATLAVVCLLYALYFVWKYRYLSKLSDMQAAARELESQLEQIE